MSLSIIKQKRDVDVADQLNSYYSPLGKNKKLAMEIIGGILVTNVHILYNKYYSGKWVCLRSATKWAILSLTKHSWGNYRIMEEDL